jgi:hypothetical protein
MMATMKNDLTKVFEKFVVVGEFAFHEHKGLALSSSFIANFSSKHFHFAPLDRLKLRNEMYFEDLRELD